MCETSFFKKARWPWSLLDFFKFSREEDLYFKDIEKHSSFKAKTLNFGIVLY